MTVWEAAIASVLKHEGGYAHDLNDAGGETNFGISKRSYPALDIKNLTRADAIIIYHRDYWAKVPSHLPDAVRWFAFDVCVHSGAGRMNSLLNQDATLMGMAANRLKFLASLDDWRHFGRGWARRVAGVLLDISHWRDEYAPPETAQVIALELPFRDRLGMLFKRPAFFRGGFAWRARAHAAGTRLDVRRERDEG